MSAQPELISEVLSAIPDIDAISHIIQRDPALSASILRLVDRPFLKHRQLSIEYAVKTLGIGRVTMAINASYCIGLAGPSSTENYALS